MTKRLRIYLLGTLLALLALVIMLWPTILSFAVQYALQSSYSPRFRPVWSGISGSWSGVHIDSIEALTFVPIGGSEIIKALPVRIAIENIWLRPALMSTLLGSRALSFSFDAYGGSISGSLSSILSKPSIDLQFSGLDLAELAAYPEIRALGIQGGILGGHISADSIGIKAVPTSTFNLELKSFTIPNNIYTSILKLSATDTVDASLQGVAKDDILTVNELNLRSEFGTMIGQGSVTLDQHRQPTKLKTTASFTLSESGSTNFGVWLPIVTNQIIASNTRSFKVTSSNVPCSSSGALFQLVLGGSTHCFKNRFEKGSH